METMRKFADRTADLAVQLLPKGVFKEWLLPALAGAVLTLSAAYSIALAPLAAPYPIPVPALGLIVALRCTSSWRAVLAAAGGSVLISAAGGDPAGAVCTVLLAGAQLASVKLRGMSALVNHAVLLAVLLASPLLLALSGVTPHRGGGAASQLALSAVCVLTAFVETRALVALASLRRGRVLTDENALALSVMAGLIVSAFSRFAPLGFRVANALSALFLLLAVRSKGVGAVACVVMLAAVRLFLTSGELLSVGVLALCALFSSIASAVGRLGAPIGFLLPALTLSTLIPGGAAVGAAESAAAAAAFVALELKFPASIGKGGALFASTTREKRLESRLVCQNYRLAALSEVLEEMAGLFAASDGTAEAFIGAQLDGVAKSLSRCSTLTDTRSRGRLTIGFGSAGCPKRGGGETGDSSCIRELEGMSLAAISDGMGSGAAAKRESLQTVQLVADLLSCGFLIEEAANCANRLLLLRERGEMYATLDALIFDHARGEMSMAKHGAPPSYILRNGEIKTLYAEALPIGIVEEAKTAILRVRLHRGDVVVMMSDGVSDALSGGEELASALVGICSESDPRLAARRLVERAELIGGGADDMTAIVARVG